MDGVFCGGSRATKCSWLSRLVRLTACAYVPPVCPSPWRYPLLRCLGVRRHSIIAGRGSQAPSQLSIATNGRQKRLASRRWWSRGCVGLAPVDPTVKSGVKIGGCRTFLTGCWRLQLARRSSSSCCRRRSRQHVYTPVGVRNVPCASCPTALQDNRHESLETATASSGPSVASSAMSCLSTRRQLNCWQGLLLTIGQSGHT